MLYAANAQIGEGPFYEEETNQLIWVDINGKTVNFLDLETKKNRCACVWGERKRVVWDIHLFSLQRVEDAWDGGCCCSCSGL